MVAKAHLLAVLKATCFASFGAGFGLSLAISIGLGLFTSPDLPFGCSSLKFCGLTAVNTVLAILLWIVGTAALAIAASIAAYIYAFPTVFLSGVAMVFAEKRLSNLERLRYWLLAGATLGGIWWNILYWAEWLPSIFTTHGDELEQQTTFAAWDTITASTFAGMMTAWMYRIWWRTETVSDY